MRLQTVRAIAKAARAWRDPDHPSRARAVERTLDCDNRFTAEAVAFAVNQQMHLLLEPALEAWIGGREAPSPRTIGVLNAGNIPLVGLQDFLAVILVGHQYRGVLSSRSPYLLPAFVEEVSGHDPELEASFCEWKDLLGQVDALIATGSNETRDSVSAASDDAGFLPESRLLRGSGFGVAVLNGSEAEDELERLAEDTLLHEGLGCRNVALVWAPEGSSPDALLEAFAHFRAVFPAHPSTSGALSMPRAFLEAVGTPHAYGDGLEFLLSKGDPEVQQPGHVRWVEYQSLDEPADWIQGHLEEIQVVVATEAVAARLPASLPLILPGEAQRPPLDWMPDGRDVVDFLAGLG